MAYSQTDRPIQIATPLGPDVFHVRSLSGVEGISQLFRYTLELVTSRQDVAIADLIGKSVTVSLALDRGNYRFFNGYVSRFSHVRQENFQSVYRAELVPWLWFLTRRADCRIFHPDMKIPAVIEKVFETYDVRDYTLKMTGEFAPREYTVQYRETDFNFVSRLLEEEGIFYYWSHINGAHTMILGDSSTVHPPCPYESEFRFDSAAGQDAIFAWSCERQLRSDGYALADFDFRTPASPVQAAVAGSTPFEVFDYPGGYTTFAQADNLVRIRNEEIQATSDVATGNSDIRTMASGHRFDLTGYFRSDQNKSHVVTQVRHEALQGDYRSGATANEAQFHYANSFECIPQSVTFRPPRVTPRPVIHGSQTAVVTGKSGEEIWTDKYGRVKVQFHWDRRASGNDDSSCWIRVAQSAAGKGWGSVFLPRVGHEVVVTFLEGDPDRPLITGTVYNGEHMPPYALPGNQTRSVVKSNSSKGGGGFNEFRLEDAKGKEQIFIHAERNYDLRVKQDRFESIGGDSHVTVEGSTFTQAKGDAHLTLTGDSNEKVSGTVSLNAAMDIQQKAGMKYALDAGMEVHVKSGMNLVVESGATLTLKVGGNFININPAGVFISGTMVMINSGGAAGSGSGASPEAPTAPKPADKATAGEVSKPPKAQRPPKPLSYSPAATVLKIAATNGTPFCEVCARAAAQANRHG